MTVRGGASVNTQALNVGLACWHPTSPLRGPEGRDETRGSSPGRDKRSAGDPGGGMGVTRTQWTPTRLCRALRANRRPPLKGEVGILSIFRATHPYIPGEPTFTHKDMTS